MIEVIAIVCFLLGIFLITLGLIVTMETGEFLAIFCTFVGFVLLVGSLIYEDMQDSKNKDKYCTESVEKGNFNSVDECKYILEKY